MYASSDCLAGEGLFLVRSTRYICMWNLRRVHQPNLSQIYVSKYKTVYLCPSPPQKKNLIGIVRDVFTFSWSITCGSQNQKPPRSHISCGAKPVWGRSTGWAWAAHPRGCTEVFCPSRDRVLDKELSLQAEDRHPCEWRCWQRAELLRAPQPSTCPTCAVCPF